MDNELSSWLQDWVAGAGGFWAAVLDLFESMLLPARLLQVEVAIGVAVLAWLAALVLRPWLNARLDQLPEGARLLRGLGRLLHRRLPLILFVLLMWAAVAVFMALYQFPSRRYVLVLIATIATAWLGIRLAAQLVRNRVLRRLLIWGLSIYATLYYLGLAEQGSAFLDSLAVEFGDFRLSVLSVLKALVVTGGLLSVARIVTTTSSRSIRANADISPSMRELMIKALQVGLYGAALFIGLKAVGFDLTGLAVLSGAIGVGLGFGLQKVVSNLVSGVIILLDKSVKPGDVISIGDTFGWINTLGARYVSVVTRDGKEYLIPNEDLITGQVVNWSHTNDLVRLDLEFGTAYSDDPHLVRRVAVEASLKVSRVLRDPKPVCHITGFGGSSVDYVLRIWIRDPAAGLTNLRGEAYLALWDAFKAEGIHIPFPQHEVRVLKD
ncbi:MAG: mechanosensitive ion channel [Paracoccaceae bacterium]